jgi:hypothetical protein
MMIDLMCRIVNFTVILLKFARGSYARTVFPAPANRESARSKYWTSTSEETHESQGTKGFPIAHHASLEILWIRAAIGQSPLPDFEIFHSGSV